MTNAHDEDENDMAALSRDLETARDRLANLIGSFPLHTDDRGDVNHVLHDAFSGDYGARTEAVYQLVDDVLAEVSVGIAALTGQAVGEAETIKEENDRLVKERDEAHDRGMRLAGLLGDETVRDVIARADALSASNEALRVALGKIGAIADIFDFDGGNRPKTGEIASWVDHRVGERTLTVEMLREARALSRQGEGNG